MIEACCEEEDGDMVMDIQAQEVLESLEEPDISLHAISGVQAPETMRRNYSIQGLFDPATTQFLL